MGEDVGADWPPIQFTDAADGTRISFRHFEGTGTPFLRVQNPGAVTLSLLPQVTSREGADRFRRGRCLIRFDWRGSGASDPIRGQLSIDQLQSDLDAVIDVVGQPVDAVVVGRSCFAVGLHAARRPERYRSIWFSGGMLRADQGWTGRYNRPGWEDDYTEHLRGLAEHTFRLDHEETIRFALLLERSVPKHAFAAYRESERDIDLTDVLPQIEMPTWVTARVPIDHEVARRIALLLPNSHFSIHPMSADNPLSDWGREQWDTCLGARLGDSPSIRAESTDGRGHEPAQTGAVTARQRDVLERVALGETNRQIAEALGIAEGTVKRHISDLLQTTGLKNRRELMRFFDRMDAPGQ